jgi:uncharacterized protein YecE (DUF72 family)
MRWMICFKQSRALASPGSCRGGKRSLARGSISLAVASSQFREVALFEGASGSSKGAPLNEQYAGTRQNVKSRARGGSVRRVAGIRIGCCGWAESQNNYCRDFGVVEVQETFYQPGRIEKYEKWRKAATEGFEFAVKAWQLITHEPSSPTYRKLRAAIPAAKKGRYGSFRPSEEVFAAWEVTDLIAQALETKMILFQSPSSFSPSLDNKRNLRTFFRTIDRRDYTLCWEPRGEWQDKDIRRVCSDLDLVHCVDPFKSKPVHGRARYFRLHGRPGYNLRYRYSEEDLEELLRTIDRKAVYVLFNNFNMLHDARRFQRLIAGT